MSPLTPKQLRQAADLMEQIEAARGELNALLGAAPAQAPEAPEAPAAPKAGKIKLSAEGIANIRAGVRKRQAKRLAAMAGKSSAPAPATAKPAQVGKTGMTVKAAILKALASGKAMDKKAIATSVSIFRGKKTKPTTLSPTLDEMKNEDKTITNPSRGCYKIK